MIMILCWNRRERYYKWAWRYLWCLCKGMRGSCLPGYCDYTWQLHQICSFKNKSCTHLQPDHTTLRIAVNRCTVLARLMQSVKEALTSEIKISRLMRWSDSKVAWYWIVQSTKEWKKFVQHRVDEIRKLVPTECWNHCPGPDNPANILSRGMDCRDLTASNLWWSGPK